MSNMGGGGGVITIFWYCLKINGIQEILTQLGLSQSVFLLKTSFEVFLEFQKPPQDIKFNNEYIYMCNLIYLFFII